MMRLVAKAFRQLRRLAQILLVDVGVVDRSFRIFPLPSWRSLTLLLRQKEASGRRWHRIRLRRRSDWFTFEEIFIKESYDLRRLQRWPELIDTYRSIVDGGSAPLIIDAGANVGFSTFYFHTLFPDSLVVALEPEPSNFEILSDGLKEESSILCLKAGLAGEDRRLAIVDSGLGSRGFRTTGTSENGGTKAAGDCVPGLSVPSLIARAREERSVVPFLIKIDIEGFEQEVFSTNTDWIDDFPLLIIELHDYMLPSTANSQNFLKAISSRRRDFVHIDENVFSIRND